MPRKRGLGLNLEGVHPELQVLAEIDYLGGALLDRKATLPHGEFQKWMQESKWPASPRTMRLYMQIASWLRSMPVEKTMAYRDWSIRQLAEAAKQAAVREGKRRGPDGLKRSYGAIPLPAPKGDRTK